MTSTQPILSHRDLLVWQKAMDLVDLVYDLADQFPREELFGLRSQVTRAAVAIPSNIAEGQTRSTSRDFAHFLDIARSSAMETDTQLLIAVRRRFVSAAEAHPAFALIEEISKMTTSLQKRIRARGTNVISVHCPLSTVH